MKKRNHWWQILALALLASAALVWSCGFLARAAAEEQKDPAAEEQAKKDALRRALGYDPAKTGENVEKSLPEPDKINVPEFEAKPTPEEEHATYLKSQLNQIEEEQKSLATLKADIQKELKKLEEVQAQIDQRLAKEDQATELKVTRLIAIYDKMRLDELAPVLEKLPDDLRVKVLNRLKEKKVGQLLELMDPDTAAKTSKLLLNKKSK